MTSAAGPRLRELETIASKARTLRTEVAARLANGEVLTFEAQVSNGAYGSWAHGRVMKDRRNLHWTNGRSLTSVVLDLVKKADKVKELDVNSIKCSSSKSQVKGAALKDVCLYTWHEVLGVRPPSEAELARLQEEKKKARKEKGDVTRAKKKELLALLTDESLLSSWNERAHEAKSVGPFRKVNLSGRKLAGAQLADMPEGNFEGCDLSEGRLRHFDFSKSSFKNATLKRARLEGAKLKGADFTGADLTEANLKGADLRGANFSGAVLTDVTYQHTAFDADTTWPVGFEGSHGLRWVGEGPNPAALAAIETEKRASGPVDFDTFMKRLEASLDPKRLKKSIAMLKQSSFELFAEVDENELVGVVKSQTDDSLVYSCRLASNGAFSCCTQNLNVCGGLRGALCKHLILLAVGLAKAGQIDADAVDGWVQKSLVQTPSLDRDAMGAILLKYKGAEAGEIDWRPTETVPEDFYAL